MVNGLTFPILFWVNNYVESLQPQVRAGNTDIQNDTSNDKVLCENQLCYMTGNLAAVWCIFPDKFYLLLQCIFPHFQQSVYSDCMTLLKGKYITIQPNSPSGTWHMEANIVKVVAYCGNPEADEKLQCMPVDLDSCANRDHTTATKSIHTL